MADHIGDDDDRAEQIIRLQPRELREHERHVHTDHKVFTLCKVDHLHHSEDDRQAHGDERVYAAHHHAVDQ